jgi:hypothetical protein
MADWEDEMENVEPVTSSTTTQPIVSEIESESIIKPKIVEQKPQEPKENPNDYEKKWQEKNKDLIERKKKDEITFEGLEDTEKQKRLIDKRIIDDASDFMGGDKSVSKNIKEETILPLVNEKDFIDLAVKNVTRIKEANKPSKFTFTYLKQSLDLLTPTLDGDKLDQLIKDLTIAFNKKRKTEIEKKPGKTGKAKPSVSAGKGLDRAEKMGAFEDYGRNEDANLDEDYEEDDFI